MKDNKPTLSVSVCNGKYTVTQDSSWNLKALRYGKEWRDCCGDNLILCMAQEIAHLRDKLNGSAR